MNRRKICALLAAAMLLSLVPVNVNATQLDPGESLSEEVMPAVETEPATEPTVEPTAKPTTEPTAEPTQAPTAKPATEPTEAPTAAPTAKPTQPSTAAPTQPPEEGPMTVSDEFIAVLKKMEGFHPVAYWDYSQWTIGYGTKCPEGKEKYYTEDNPFPEEEAVKLLHEELAYFEKVVNDFAQTYDLEFEQHQFDALVSFSYNCGGSWVRDVNGYFNTAIREGDMSNRIIYGFLLWSTAGGDYILVNRRKCEANMYINGVYKAYNTANSVPANFRHIFLDGNGGTVKYTIHGYNADDPSEIVTNFSSKPTGVGKDGKIFTYTFAGWYTAPEGGTRVKTLDGSLPNGTVLYARWKDPQGNIVTLPKGEAVDNIAVSVTGKVNVRTGPGTFYPIEKELQPGAKLVITETYKVGSTLWGKCEHGWLSLHYTNYSDIVSGNTPEEIDGQWGTVKTESGGTVNVRKGPSTSYGVVYTVKTGDRLQIFALKSDGAMQWGQLSDGNWISMDYVELDELAQLESIEIQTSPKKLEYVQMQDKLDVSGGTLKLTFSDGSAKTVNITSDMVTGFSNKNLGEVTVTVKYEDKATTFTVTVVKATVIFKNYDGKVISTAQYAYGEAVKEPAAPVKPADEENKYQFTGWDKEVTACKGNAVYTAVFKAIPLKTPGVVVTESGSGVNVRKGPGTSYDVAYEAAYGTKIEILETKSDGKRLWGQLPDGNWICMDYVKTTRDKGDMDGNFVLNEDDAIYLLRHVIFPDKYPVDEADVNGDKKVNEDDAIYLLRHVIFPDKYPLKL
ncbi:MAG: SH3 domain-containing protein [Oscillospiraceae bacterium]|nr:SH3 domain-containing protein [Oscillospiraceae bacterium]